MDERMQDLTGKVAVVTGGANGVGKGICRALLALGARVVVVDVEASVLDAAVAELSALGPVEGRIVDVSDSDAVEALAEHVFTTYGACHLLFNNAGVTSGGGGKPWEQEANDWRWCFNVNVFGVVWGCLAFVPRMLASGEPGVVVNTSSGDGGFAPVPFASVYASSKAAVSCFTEALANQLVAEGPDVRAAVFYPSGGLLDTGLWTAGRNRPADLERVKPRPAAPATTFDDFKRFLAEQGREVEVMDLDELGRFCVAGVQEGRFIIGHGMDEVREMLHRRADAIGESRLPEAHFEG
ncbi:MAG: SDR family NAD(P)-dependent oxidoreductase [Actinomycetes bacterium]